MMTDLDERYGRRGGRPARSPEPAADPDLEGKEPAASRSQMRWIGLVAAALTVGTIGFWVLSTMFGGVANQSIRADTLRFYPSEHGEITIDFHVTAPANSPLACAIEAQSERYAVVGWDVVQVPPVDAASQDVTHTLRTVGDATTVVVKECWVDEA